MQHIYNTYSKTKEVFKPIDKTPVGSSDKKPQIKIYVCGQTVYDYCHIGHARKVIVFDMIRRWFIASGYEVIFVENITDVDDKIINRADENHESIHELTTRFIQAMNRDFALLNVISADYAPKATDYIPQMVTMIQELINKGCAYIAENGDVYFSVRKFKNYGHLSGKKLEELNAGERVSINEIKKDPLDFVLWKSTSGQKNRDAAWDAHQHGAEFGEGRPGWHIECSAMSNSILGAHFDIHGGGQDLIFPHHENEIAQSESCNDQNPANYWMHNGFITIQDDKMSKSLGNFVLVHDLLQEYHAEVIRYFMLKTHYRSPLNYNKTSLQEAKDVVDRIYHTLEKYSDDTQKLSVDYSKNLIQQDAIDLHNPELKNLYQKFVQAMQDDFNTPLAITCVQNCLGLLKEGDDCKEVVTTILEMAHSLGMLITPIADYMSFGAQITEEEINKLIEKRAQAKQTKNYQLADEIRQKLQTEKIAIKDNPDGTTSWYVI